jgi:hypothetical protein
MRAAPAEAVAWAEFGDTIAIRRVAASAKLSGMSRLARIVVPGLAHHVTQRGNRREAIFFEEEDRAVDRDRLAEHARRYGVGSGPAA